MLGGVDPTWNISLPHPEAPPTKPKCSLLNTTEHLVCVRSYSRHWRNFDNQIDKSLCTFVQRGSYSSGGSRKEENQKG